MFIKIKTYSGCYYYEQGYGIYNGNLLFILNLIIYYETFIIENNSYIVNYIQDKKYFKYYNNE